MLKAFRPRRFLLIHLAFGGACASFLLGNHTSAGAKPASAAKSQITTAIVGQLAPALIVVDASGQKRALSGLRGKKSLLITFFPRCFTGSCTSQLNSLRDAYPALQKAGVEVWGVSTDAAAGVRGQRAFARHLKLPFPLIPDTDRRLCLAFGAVQSPEQMAARMSVFIDNRGIVRWIDKQIGIRTHGADVLARVQAEANAKSTQP